MPPVSESALASWLPRQRWYGAKSVPIELVRVADRGTLVALVDVTPQGLPPARYAVPELTGDGFISEEVRRRWFTSLAAPESLDAEHGRLRFESFGLPAGYGSSRLLGAEQSNTSVLYADAAGAPRWVLKLFRRVQTGENPDFEIPRALAQHTAFRNVPPALGRLVYESNGGAATLAVLQAFIANQGDGWEYFLTRLRDSPSALLDDLRLLGRRTAELHCALASIPADPAFAPESITPADQRRWIERAQAGAHAAAPEDAALLAPWRARLSESGMLAALAGCHKIRIHGDYHLGQTLKTPDDFFLFDFEGEPARPLSERRRKGTVLQDVAGMLRSLGYAAHTAQQPSWELPARQAFLDAYRAAITAAPVPLIPTTPAAFDAACRFFECEKAVYELAYERNNRPQWVEIPLAALHRLL